MSKTTSDGQNTLESRDATSVTIAFGPRFATSDQFNITFKEGMALVERTAAYLDGEGRKEAKGLKPPISVVYATESMRLTTRLLELASWLLIRRALNEGEISTAEAEAKRSRVKLRTMGRPNHINHYGELPEGLKSLIEESFRLTDRVAQFDRSIEAIAASKDDGATNPVAGQLAQLNQAFGVGHRPARFGRKS